jgi:hypothetical protein
VIRGALTRSPQRAELDVERAAALLHGCKDVDQVKDLRDRAAAVQVWLRHQRASISAQNDAAEIALRAERRLGELLMSAPKARGTAGKGRPKKGGSDPALPIGPATLAEQGIDRKLASRAQKLAAVPEQKFEAHVGAVRARAEKLTTSGTIAAHSHVEGYDSDEYYTPEEYLEAARQVLGGIDLDPATSAAAQQRVRASRFWTKADDGLHPDRRWAGRVWMNPPYSRGLVDAFTARLIEAYLAGAVPAAIALYNASTDTGWFHDLARLGSLCLTASRIPFITPSGQPLEGTRVGQAFFCLGDDDTKTRFEAVFSDYGLVGQLWTGSGKDG